MELNYNVNKSEIIESPKGTRRVVYDFLQSGNDCAEVTEFGEKTVYSVRRNFDQYVHINRLPVRVTVRNGRLFLLRKAENDE